VPMVGFGTLAVLKVVNRSQGAVVPVLKLQAVASTLALEWPGGKALVTQAKFGLASRKVAVVPEAEGGWNITKGPGGERLEISEGLRAALARAIETPGEIRRSRVNEGQGTVASGEHRNRRPIHQVGELG